MQKPLPDNKQHWQETDVHASGGVPTRNPSKRAAADSRLRPRGHWDRQCQLQYYGYSIPGYGYYDGDSDNISYIFLSY